jgi:transcriptional regulator with XRE-family HTH domain
MNLGRAIRRSRKKIKMTQKELAKKIGISMTSLVSIERNVKQPRKVTLYAIAEALDISVSRILWRSIEETDVAPEMTDLFKALQEPVDNLFS